jgi:Methyl-CpG binding domain
MSRMKKQPSKGKKAGGNKSAMDAAELPVPDEADEETIPAAAAAAPDSPSDFFADDAKPKADEGAAGAPSKDGGDEDEDDEEEELADTDSEVGDENRKVAAVGAKRSAAAKQGAEDDLSETAAALAAVVKKAAAAPPAAKRTTRSSTQAPVSTEVRNVEHFPKDQAASHTPNRSFMGARAPGGSPARSAASAAATPNRPPFMSTIDSEGSRTTLVRKVARKKVADLAASARKSLPSAEVKRQLRESVIGNQKKQGAARAKPRSRVIGSMARAAAPRAPPGRKRAESSDDDDSDFDERRPAKKSKREVETYPVKKSKREEEPYWFGKPDDVLFDGFRWPKGWTKELIQRKSGKTAGILDAYWYSPGRRLRFRSKAELQRFFNAVGKVDEAEAYRAAIKPKK